MDFIDVSSNNSPVDVQAYAASGRTFLLRKVSEGVGYHWAGGDTLADECHAARLSVGHYHWLRPDSDPAEQANFFVGLIRSRLVAGDRLMTDFEATSGVTDPPDAQRAHQLTVFNAVVRQLLPAFELLVYTGNWYLAGKPACQASVRPYGVIVSDYEDDVPDDQLANPYGLTYVARQYTSSASIAGVHPVDASRWLSGHTPAGGGTVITPTNAADEDDMTQAFLVPGKDSTGAASNRWWIVAIDYTTRVQVLDIANAQALAGKVEDRKPFINASMTYDQLRQVPDMTNHSSAAVVS